jgi:uncharacterized membrane protein YkgB
MQRHSVTALRLAIGLVYLWFGALKFFPSRSPAEGLAARTIERLSGGLVTSRVSLPLLAAWECSIGVGLLWGHGRRSILALLWTQMAGTFLPLLFFPRETFAKPLVPTLEGQYIFKNIVIVAGAMVVAATVRPRVEAAPAPGEDGVVSGPSNRA